MTANKVLPDGANWLTPYMTVAEAEASLDFYQRAFGFTPGMTMPGPDGKIVHADMTYQGTSIIMFAPQGSWGETMKTPAHSGSQTPISLYVYCEDVDALVKQAREAGAKVLAEPEDMFWGDRMARLEDPDGYQWSFATKVGEFDPSKIPPM